MSRNEERETYLPPPGPPPSYYERQEQQQQQHRSAAQEASSEPPGPPPSYRQQQQQHHDLLSESYAPPPGPPPSTHNQNKPNNNDAEPTTSHPWTLIPDTALLPPPPALPHTLSPTANASATAGTAAYHWTLAHPLLPPQPLTPAQHAAIQPTHGAVVLRAPPPPTFTGDLRPGRAPGRWHLRTLGARRQPDACLTSALPLYAALHDSPLLLRGGGGAPREKTIYFELQPRRLRGEAGIAIGFLAPPYPAWRLPGWQRGSLAVHGDDGRRYVNDTFGGVDCVAPWREGERVGLGMRFVLAAEGRAEGEGEVRPPAYTDLAVEVFFTRNGRVACRWDGREELDARCLGGHEGLLGECDIFAAVGVYGEVEAEVFFRREDWVFKP